MRGASDEEMLEELRACAERIDRDTVTMSEFEQYGRCSPSTISRRFGSWPKALGLAKLAPSRSRIGISNEELFENIRAIWLQLGRQPRYAEIKAPISKFSAGTYENRFGTWRESLTEFVAWVNSDSPQPDRKSESGAEKQRPTRPKKRTKRDISDRQRFRILVRDGFRCLSCGASPLKTPGIELHVDHILPWSKGGETVDENLQAKCSQCNLGKGNAFDS